MNWIMNKAYIKKKTKLLKVNFFPKFVNNV